MCCRERTIMSIKVFSLIIGYDILMLFFSEKTMGETKKQAIFDLYTLIIRKMCIVIADSFFKKTRTHETNAHVS
jgi:L-cystine uptake protein TcyP (sodium:dicarboxylate symporter family)